MFVPTIVALLSVLIFSTIWKFVTREHDFDDAETKYTIEQEVLINSLVDEINTALSLGKSKLVHTFNPGEAAIDNTIASMVCYKVSRVTPCMITFDILDNGDLEINVQKITGEQS